MRSKCLFFFGMPGRHSKFQSATIILFPLTLLAFKIQGLKFAHMFMFGYLDILLYNNLMTSCFFLRRRGDVLEKLLWEVHGVAPNRGTLWSRCLCVASRRVDLWKWEVNEGWAIDGIWHVCWCKWNIHVFYSFIYLYISLNVYMCCVVAGIYVHTCTYIWFSVGWRPPPLPPHLWYPPPCGVGGGGGAGGGSTSSNDDSSTT